MREVESGNVRDGFDNKADRRPTSLTHRLWLTATGLTELSCVGSSGYVMASH